MTANEFCVYELDSVGNQLRRAVEGMTDDQWSQNTEASSMSAKDMFAHLAECYVAAQKHFKGEEHSWGTYTVADNSIAGVQAAFNQEREAAVAMVRGSDDPDVLKNASNYITQHDAYHVGQLCAMRLKFDPNWNAYAIYE